MKSAHLQSPSLPVASSNLRTGPISILGAAFGSLLDGFVVTDSAGKIQQINQPAERICHLLDTSGPYTNRLREDNALPPEIWHVCKTALRKKDALSNQSAGIDADIVLPELGIVRTRVQNISFGQTPYLLILLEDRQQTTRNKALSEAAICGLTERETEIWQLRLRGDAYKEISAALWISIDTVKKHLKNIRAKQRIHQDELEYALIA